VRRTVPPSAEIEEQIDRLLAVGVGENPRESLSELARLMVIGAFVRGLSMRDIESLCEKAGSGCCRRRPRNGSAPSSGSALSSSAP
jgi:hypothetical protein